MTAPPIHRLDRFDGASDLDRGRTRRTEMAWYAVKLVFFQSGMVWPARWKAAILRAFGASVGTGFVCRPRVNIHFPWKLAVGDHCWIGERCELLNLEPITMGNHVALAHDVYLAAASHDIDHPAMRYDNRPIVIEDGCWIATRALIGPGVTIGRGSVVAGGSIVIHDVEPGSVVAGNPARRVRERRLPEERP